jgi:hypothetical protein
MIFHPLPQRRYYIDGGIEFVLGTEFNATMPMGNIAASKLDDAVVASLLGLNAEIAPIIPRVLEWLDYAIDGKERMGESPSFHHMRLHWARAIAKWMSSSANAEADWMKTIDLEKEDWSWGDKPWSTSKIIRDRLDDYMAFALQASRYAEGIETYERMVGAKKITLSKTLKPRDYAYALCLQQTQGQFNDEDLFEAGRRVLQANLEEEWLGRGQSIRAATWLKIVYWDRDLRAGRAPVLTPLQALLKAYDDMPNVPRPDFLGSVD